MTIEEEPGWIPEGDFDVLGYTVIGSHVWGMDHEGSDIDTCAIVQHPTELVIRSQAPMLTRSEFRSTTDHDWPVDIHIHEVKRIVEFLEKGNINAVVAVHSPLVLRSTPAFEKLRRIGEKNPMKAIHHSARGMAMSNWKRYRREGSAGREVMPEHRARKLLRGLEFATRICEDEVIEFRPPEGEPTMDGITKAVQRLDEAYLASDLPEHPGEVYRDWLEEVRNCSSS